MDLEWLQPKRAAPRRTRRIEFVKNRQLLAATDFPAFGIGFVAAFVSAFLCVRWLLRYVSRNDFVPFAWYRIAFGAIIVVTAYAGLVDWS